MARAETAGDEGGPPIPGTPLSEGAGVGVGKHPAEVPILERIVLHRICTPVVPALHPVGEPGPVP
jgi:hypothetical protein